METPLEFSRSALLLGDESIEKLKSKSVTVFGLGGVGSYAVEALARSGIGSLTIIDGDNVDITNINRQLIALHSTVGQAKVLVAEQRIKDINPDCRVRSINAFVMADEADKYITDCDYVVDAIDTVSTKLAMAQYCYKNNIPLISCMGMGNKLDPAQIQITDIYSTSVCPLCKVMRRELKNRDIKKLKVVFSAEDPIKHEGGRTPGSMAFVPSVAGLYIASAVIKDLLEEEVY